MSKRVNKEKLIEKFRKELERRGIPPDSIDLEAEIDWSLSFEEIKKQFAKIVRAFSGATEDEIHKMKEGHKEYLSELERKEVEKLVEEIREIVKKDTVNLDKYYKKVYLLMDILLSDSSIFGLYIYGEAGIGKSFSVIKYLEEHGFEFERDYVLVRGHITPLGLYELLYEYNGRIIVFDDIYSIFDNEIGKALLLNALWDLGGGKGRYISYHSTKLGVPKTFRIKPETKFIFIGNSIPEEFKPFLDRILLCPLSFDFKTKIRMLSEYSKLKGYPKGIVKFLVETCNDNTYDLSFRVVDKLNSIRKHCKEWRDIAYEQLQRVAEDEEVELVKKLLEKHERVGRAIREFMEITGKSRRTFYNIRKRLLLREGKYKRYCRIKSDI